ncbi:MAG: T9SS type A sorting domain-containing protein [Bacteroidetes bacterium]|nr:T9SS type A sorting domain-containing protein [Bacteroidota bacterium]
MRNLKSTLALAALIGFSSANGQTCTGYVQPPNDLVQNGGMEYFSKPCANLEINNGPFYPCCFWTYPLSSNTTSSILASDYYNACAPTPTTNVQAGNSVNASLNLHNFSYGSPPTAFMAVSPHTGNGYSGISVCQSTSGFEHREYITSQLVSTLQVGATYQFSAWVRLSPDSQYGIQNLSVLFSNAPAVQGTSGSIGLPINPAAGDLLVPLSTSPVTNKTGWVQLTANVVIPTGSSFSYITIGNYSTNAATTLSSLLPVGTANSVFSYYFVDDVSLTYVCGPITPSIAVASTYCYGSPISFVGSSTGTANYNVWTVVESDQFGTPVVGATEWWSPWFTGNPGYYTLPSVNGPALACGKYYRIKLAVGNDCYGWVETTQVIYLNCPPLSYSLADQTICNGDCVTLSVPGPLKHHSYTWTYQSDEPFVISTVNSVVVCPTQTSTYCITVTNNLTGCSTTTCTTVYVETANPAFSLSVTPTAATYQTFKGTPVQTTNLPSGFGFVWFVEELDGSYNTIYTVNSSDPNLIPCWWTFPGAEDFDGFDGTTPTPTLSTSCSPSLGKFKYNTNYRITRGTWSDNCPWTQMSYLVYTAKTADGNVVIVEDENAPDFSYLMNDVSGVASANGLLPLADETTLSVYPNPSNDLVNLTYSFNEGVSGKITITDISGRTVQTLVLSANTGTIKLDMMANENGIYFVNLFEGDELIKTEKLILNH